MGLWNYKRVPNIAKYATCMTLHWLLCLTIRHGSCSNIAISTVLYSKNNGLSLDYIYICGSTYI